MNWCELMHRNAAYGLITSYVGAVLAAVVVGLVAFVAGIWFMWVGLFVTPGSVGLVLAATLLTLAGVGFLYLSASWIINEICKRQTRGTPSHNQTKPLGGVPAIEILHRDGSSTLAFPRFLPGENRVRWFTREGEPITAEFPNVLHYMDTTG